MGALQMITVGGGELAAFVDGAPDKPWIVVSNNLGGTHRVWRRQMSILTTYYRVLRYDARGHGDSSAPPGPYSLDMLVGDVVALMDHFHIAKADFIGVSMGAITGMGLAIGHPGRVGRLICCDARADAPQPFIDNWTVRIKQVREGGVKGIVEFLMGIWFTPGFREKHPETIGEATDMVLRTNAESWMAIAEAMKKLDYKRSLGSVRAKTLFIAGAQDGASSPAVMRDMAAATPGADFIEVDPGAHLCMIENPDGFNRVIDDWLGGQSDLKAAS